MGDFSIVLSGLEADSTVWNPNENNLANLKPTVYEDRQLRLKIWLITGVGRSELAIRFRLDWERRLVRGLLTLARDLFCRMAMGSQEIWPRTGLVSNLPQSTKGLINNF
jgi:hypothetical protein